MNIVKKYLGIVWLLIAPAVIFFLVNGAVEYIDLKGTKDINNPVIWIIIITIFTPVAIGLMIFGLYALMGAYDHLPESSSEVED
jgi:Na+/H+-dicarboxylate symporter